MTRAAPPSRSPPAPPQAPLAVLALHLLFLRWQRGGAADAAAALPGATAFQLAAPAVHVPAAGAPRAGADADADAPPSVAELAAARASTRAMFSHAFGGYMAHAFPRDDLRPLSCAGADSQGGVALTLLDALDSLILFNESAALRRAVAWVEAEAPRLFDRDARVHVFELTIRALGGLLSAHAALAADPGLAPGYGGGLLAAAADLGDRLLPAFGTPTGLPLSWVHLRRGRLRGDTRVTCTACAGTLLLEFGALSRATGDARYEAAAARAMKELWARRSARSLLGNTLSVDSGAWARADAGVGAGADSFYEYALKAWLAFGDRAHLAMFAEAYGAATAQLQLAPALNGASWLLPVHMTSGRLLHPYVSALAAFWPGLQALAGRVRGAAAGHADWLAAWRRFGGTTPESFHASLSHAHPTLRGAPLRPELAESTFLIHAAAPAGSPLRGRMLRAATELAGALANKTRAPCGHAGVFDVATGALDDRMESFFLAETLKYLDLALAGAGAAPLVDHVVLTTEAHFVAPFPAASDAELAGELEEVEEGDGSEAGGRTCTAGDAAAANGTAAASCAAFLEAPRAAAGDDDEECAALCRVRRGELEASTAALRAALPTLPVHDWAPRLLRRRRCAACRAAAAATASARLRACALWRAPRAGAPPAHAAPAQWAAPEGTAACAPPPPRQFVCPLGVLAAPARGLACTLLREVPPAALSSQGLQALGANVVFVQVADAGARAAGPGGAAAAAGDAAEAAGLAGSIAAVDLERRGRAPARLAAMAAEFGPELMPGCDSRAPGGAAEARRAWAAAEARRAAVAAVDADEPPAEVGETDEDVRARIAALAAGGGAGAPDEAEAASAGIAAAAAAAAAGESSDEYLDPASSDEFWDAEEGEEEDAPPACDAAGPPVLASPADACAPLANAAAARGAVVLALRGNCSFVAKALAAGAAGAAALVVVNGVGDRLLAPMGDDPDARRRPRLPAALVSGADGAALLAAAREGGAAARLAAPTLAERRALALAAVWEARAARELAAPRGFADAAAGAPACPAPADDAQTWMELVVPPTSQAWVSHQVHQQGLDITPVFEALAAHLGAEQRAAAAAPAAAAAAEAEAEVEAEAPGLAEKEDIVEEPI